MAKKTIYVSDDSGAPIQEGRGAKVRISFNDARRGVMEKDVTDSEAEAISQNARKVNRRGRKPGATSTA